MLAGEGGLRLDGRPLDRAALLHLYQAHDFAPLWVTEPRREAALLQALGGAAEHGLDPAAFVVSATRPEQRELLLTDAFLRYAPSPARPAPCSPTSPRPSPATAGSRTPWRVIAASPRAAAGGRCPTQRSSSATTAARR